MKYIAPEFEALFIATADIVTTSSNKGNESGDTFTPDEEL